MGDQLIKEVANSSSNQMSTNETQNQKNYGANFLSTQKLRTSANICAADFNLWTSTHALNFSKRPSLKFQDSVESRKTGGLRISTDFNSTRQEERLGKNNSLNVIFNETSSTNRSKRIQPIKGTVMLLQKNAQIPHKLTASGVYKVS